MMIIKDATGYEKQICEFTIAGESFNEDTLLVNIFKPFKKFFDGYEFKDTDQFSMADMFQSCAREAYFYNDYGKCRENLETLKNILGFSKEEMLETLNSFSNLR